MCGVDAFPITVGGFDEEKQFSQKFGTTVRFLRPCDYCFGSTVGDVEHCISLGGANEVGWRSGVFALQLSFNS